MVLKTISPCCGVRASLMVHLIFMSDDLSVSWHYVVTLRRGRMRTREQLLLLNYNTQRHAVFF